MTEEQEQIRGKKKKLDEKFEKLDALKRRTRFEWNELQRRCKHPNKYKVSRQGEVAWYCPDCGWEQ